MGGNPSGDGGIDDPHRPWRRPAPGAGPVESTSRNDGSDTAAADPQRAIWGPDADRDAPPPQAPAPPPMPPPAPPSTEWSPGTAHPTAVPTGARPPVQRGMASGHLIDPMGHGSDDGPESRSLTPTVSAESPPSGTRFARWWGRLGIVAAMLIVIGTVVALASGSGDDETGATSPPTRPSTATPTTTVRRTTTSAPDTTATPTPRDTTAPGAQPDGEPPAPENDPRVLLTGLPDGYEALNASLIDGWGGGAFNGLLFVADGATWSDGPWVRVGPLGADAFVGPVTPGEVAGLPSRVGRGADGAELTVVDFEAGPVTVSAKGLPQGTTSTVVAALATSAEGTWSIPAAALPAGLHPATGDLAESFRTQRRAAAHVVYQTPSGGTMTLFTSLAEPGSERASVAAFYLADLTYVTIDGDSGVMGTFDYPGGQARSVQWSHEGVDIELTSYTLDAPALLELAALARTRADGGWTEQDWDRAAVGDSGGEGAASVELGDVALGDGTASVTAQRADDSLWWSAGARGTGDGSASGIGRYGQEATPIVLQVAATAREPFDDTPSYVVAMALGDASLDGAMLRLRTGTLASGGEGAGSEAGGPLNVLDLEESDASAPGFGYTHGAALSTTWEQGEFVAEIVAADGVTILATATLADLS